MHLSLPLIEIRLTIFLAVFQMLVDTLLLCFCEDVKINDGTEEKPYYMSKNLMVRRHSSTHDPTFVYVISSLWALPRCPMQPPNLGLVDIHLINCSTSSLLV